MYVYIYLFIYLSMYLYIYIFIFLCIYIFMYLCIYISMYLYMDGNDSWGWVYYFCFPSPRPPWVDYLLELNYHAKYICCSSPPCGLGTVVLFLWIYLYIYLRRLIGRHAYIYILYKNI